MEEESFYAKAAKDALYEMQMQWMRIFAATHDRRKHYMGKYWDDKTDLTPHDLP